MSIDDLLDLARGIREAVIPHLGSRSELKMRGAGGDLMRKIDSIADAEARKLAEKYNAGIVTEESGMTRRGEGLIIIDPVDGSANADRGIRFASVSVAYSSGERASSLEMGAVVDIFTGDEYYAIRGNESYKNGRKISIGDLDGPPVVYAPCRKDTVLLRKLRDISMRDLGSIALGLCYAAEGIFDAVIDVGNFVRAFDIAAGILIVKEAGGSIFSDGDFLLSDVKRCISFAAGKREAVMSLLRTIGCNLRELFAD
ncbi:MAG: inositol monophosphatase family protein [Candidatus Methanodesulfokora sp.]|jgi:myo-inositol-1(or 4)-monophosphatase